MKTLVYFALALSLPLTAQRPGAVRAQTVLSSGVQVMDGNGQDLGTLQGLSSLASYTAQPGSFLTFKNNYFVTLRFDGSFPISFESFGILMWTGDNCTGQVFLLGTTANVASTHLVVYSGQANLFYVPAGSGPLATAITTPTILSVESGFNDMNDGSVCYPVGNWVYPGWALTPFDVQKSLGWTVSGNPARVASPVSFQ